MKKNIFNFIIINHIYSNGTNKRKIRSSELEEPFKLQCIIRTMP